MSLTSFFQRLTGSAPPARPDVAGATHIILGSGKTGQPGWVSTDRAVIDLCDRATFARHWQPATRHAFMAEHVWEHLTPEDGRTAIALCFEFLRPTGTLRIAVPDQLNPAAEYREYVRPGGTGPGADDHKILYDYLTLEAALCAAGFTVERQEYWDEAGQFQHRDWSDDRGYILRSRRYDPRNQDGKLGYTSLILDGIKP